tara:strand:+ start:20 stop:661 length:642 start_codon:yes stop_codon:yes gene_type:complete
MAANEHKNLTDINRHNPMGFEVATNDTVLSKDAGTSATGTDGNLVWLPKKTIKVTTIPILGYSTGNGSTYEYRQNMTDGQSPFELAADYGDATVGAATLDVSDIFRTANYVAQDDCTVMKIRGWMVGSTANAMTLAICKVRPVAGDTSDLTPVLIDEIALTGISNDALVEINEASDITAAGINAGDLIFPMVKTDSGGMTIFFNVTLELAYDN